MNPPSYMAPFKDPTFLADHPDFYMSHGHAAMILLVVAVLAAIALLLLVRVLFVRVRPRPSYNVTVPATLTTEFATQLPPIPSVASTGTQSLAREQADDDLVCVEPPFSSTIRGPYDVNSETYFIDPLLISAG